LRPGGRAIHHQAKSLDLRVVPVVAENYRHLDIAFFGESFDAEVAVDYSVSPNEDWDSTSVFPDGGPHSAYRSAIFAKRAIVANEIRDTAVFKSEWSGWGWWWHDFIKHRHLTLDYHSNMM
jgi:hypothetical protein